MDKKEAALAAEQAAPRERRAPARAREPAPAGGGRRSRATKRAYHHGNLRDALIREGRRILETEGVGAMSLRQAARQAGVSHTAPSHHFQSKMGLLAAIAAEGFRELTERRLAAIRDASDVDDVVRQLIVTYIAFARDNRGLFQLMFSPMFRSRADYPDLMDIASKSYALFAQGVGRLAREAGWRQSDERYVVMTAWALEHGFASLLVDDQVPLKIDPVDLELAIERAASVLIAGIRSAPKP